MAVHNNPGRERSAPAPFNFVPLPEAVFIPESGKNIPPYNEYDPQRYSGWIDLHITAETPIYVRCAPPIDHTQPDNHETSNPYRRPFFHHGNPARPVLPGSSIRGMTRALFEVLSYAKMSFVDYNRKLVYRAVRDTSSLGRLYRSQFFQKGKNTKYPSLKVRAGYLEVRNNTRYIKPAREINGRTFVRVRGDAVSWAKEPNKTYEPFFIEPPKNGDVARRVQRKPAPGYEKAILVVSGPMPGKRKHCAVYKPDPNGKLIRIEQHLWELYSQDAEMHRGIPTRRINPGDPLFYLLDDQGNLVFFGPTTMFRVPYPHTIGEFVPKEHRDTQTIDLAEAVFGTTSIRSRVVFEDAPYNDSLDNCHFDECSPKILSTPKPTAFQEYLTQDNPDDKEKLRHYGDSPKDTSLRGYKFYWHKAFDRKKYWEDQIEKDEQHTIIRPLREGSTFFGRVRFDNLSELELGALLITLDLPENMRHKIGMGKPLGMGTIRIEAELHLIDREKRYASLVDDQGNLTTGELSAKRNQAVAEKTKAAFAKAMLRHYREKCASESSQPITNLWSIPRFKELAALLTWVPNRDDELFDYPADSVKSKSWKEHWVIPTPCKVMEQSRTSRKSPSSSSPFQKPKNKAQTQGTRNLAPKKQPSERDVSTEQVQLTKGQLIPGVLTGKTNKGKWRLDLGGGCSGAIINSGELPDTLGVGDKVTVQILSIAKPNCTVKWIDK